MASHSEYWKAVEIVLDRTAARRPFDEREAVLAALDFEHTGTLRRLAMCMSGIPVPSGAVADTDYQARADRETAAQHDVARSEFRKDLIAIMEGRISSADLARLERGASRVLRVPQFKSRDVGDHYVAENLAAGLSLITRIVLDPRKPFAADLCRCQLAQCGRFFLASEKKPETGKPRTKYCGKPHMVEAWKARKR